MGQARKYNLNLSDAMSCGLGAFISETVQCNLLNSFTITYDTIPSTSHTYPALTTAELQILPTIDYDSRVIDFLDYIDIESSIQKERLFTDSVIDDLTCSDYDCLLNENFLVYKFLTGIRIVNVGSVNGSIQYLVSGDSYNSGWQNNATFLNLNQNAIYNVKIRDYIADENIVVCEYSKIISMPSIIQSTTVLTPAKVVALNTTTCSINDYITYNNGNIQINPSALSPGQKIQIYYTSNATVVGGGNSCVVFNCKPNNQSSFTKIDCLTNNDISPRTNSFIMCFGDTICYCLNSVTSGYGSNANSNFCVTSVNGLNTTIPSIDITRCSASAVSCQPQLNVTASLNRCTASLVGSDTCKITGIVGFTPAIPSNEAVNVTLSAITCAIGSSNSTICFTRKTISNPVDSIVCTINNSQPQPQAPVVTANYGDTLCYFTTLNATSAGSTACFDMCINNVTASIGVNPIKSLVNNRDNASIVKTAVPIIISVCHQTCNGRLATGYINTNIPIPNNECVSTCFIYDINLQYTLDFSKITFFCRPLGGSGYSIICNIDSRIQPNTGDGEITWGAGDSICYNLTLLTGLSSQSYTQFSLNSVSSSSGLIPSISPTRYSDSIGTSNFLP